MSFINDFMDAQDGGVVATVNQRYEELKTAVLSHKEPGVLTIKMKMSPDKFNSRGDVIVVGLHFSVDTKAPAEQPGHAVFFVDDGGRLSRNAPGQDELFAEREERKHV